MPKSVLKKALPFIGLLLAHLIWGANFVVAKLTLQEFPVTSLSFLRFIFALILLIPFVLAEKKKLRLKLKDLPRIFLVGSLMTTLNIFFFYQGITRTTVIQASSLMLTVPIFSVFIGWAFLKEKIFVVNLFGIVAGLIGAVTIIGLPNLIFGSFNLANILGGLFILIASLAWVVGSILSKPLLKRYTTLDLTAAMFGVGAISFALPALSDFLNNPGWVNQVSFLGSLGLVYIVLLSSISAYFLFEWGLGRVGPTIANLFHYVEPVIATYLGVLVLGEPLRVSYLLGAALIILGIYWGTYAKTQHLAHHKAHRV